MGLLLDLLPLEQPTSALPSPAGGDERRVVLRNFLTPPRRDERDDELVLALLGVL